LTNRNHALAPWSTKANWNKRATSAVDSLPDIDAANEAVSVSSPQSPKGARVSVNGLLGSIFKTLFDAIEELKAELKKRRKEMAEMEEKKGEPRKTPQNSSARLSRGRCPKPRPKPVDEDGEPIKGEPGPKKGRKKSNPHRDEESRMDPN
jgi:hypothetical protein